LTHIGFLIPLLILLFTVAFWSMRLRDIVQAVRKVPVLTPQRGDCLPAEAPLISVIVPAHNEEAVIEDCLKSVLQQDYPRYELVLVDDRSTDRTASKAEEVLRGRRNCRIVSVDHLPTGWTGKCHALAAAIPHVSGEWFAFLDADSVLHPNALTRCYGEAIRSQVSMVTLSPRLVLKSFWERALQPAFAAMACILHSPAKINDPASPVASANGMFYLISRGAYDRIGGHAEVRDLAVEDIGIGKRVKAAGLGLIFANGRCLLHTRMYTDLNGIIRGWARILSAAMNYEPSTVLKYLVMHILMSFPVLAAALYFYTPEALLLWPSSWPILPVICLTQLCVIPPLFCVQLGIHPRCAALLFLGNLALIWVFVLILKRIVRQDALQWRGTVYPESRHQPTNLNPAASPAFNRPPALKEAN